jgi:hypothetical protein
MPIWKKSVEWSDRDSLITRLDLLGWTQQEISDRLTELFPEAKGTSDRSVRHILGKNGQSDFCRKIDSDLRAGHAPEHVAKRNEVSLILVWAVKLKGMHVLKTSTLVLLVKSAPLVTLTTTASKGPHDGDYCQNSPTKSVSSN